MLVPLLVIGDPPLLQREIVVGIDLIRSALPAEVAVLLSHVHRKGKKLWGGDGPGRGGRDGVVVRDHGGRFHGRSFRESRRGERSFDRAVESRKCVDRGQLAGAVDGRGGEGIPPR